MKCLVLAGGKGERLWPLSRKSFPKQFIRVQGNHSLFQETIARNMAYCDEFIIVTNDEYRSIIANQMEAFQGLPYRCLYEEEPRKTTAAIVLACLDLQPSEKVFVAAADHLVDTGECDGLNYKDSILQAKELAGEGKIVLFGKRTKEISERFGYYSEGQFCEKPDRMTIKTLQEQPNVLQNLGLMLFQSGTLLQELKRIGPELLEQCRAAYLQREHAADGVVYCSAIQQGIMPVAIEKSVIEKTDRLAVVETGFDWSDIGSLEDLGKTALQADGVAVQNECTDTVILNQSPEQAVVVNDLDNVLVVNTTDAVYIGRRGKSHLLKGIIHDNPELEPYMDQGTVSYRPWGYYEELKKENHYRIRKVVLLPGKTIYEHRHMERKENWTIIQGTALITLNGKGKTCYPGQNIDITPAILHQISNVGEKPVVFVETAYGDELSEEDNLSDKTGNVTEAELGLKQESIIKLLPAYKDYLWGGTKLRDLYGKQCDFDTIAESWELSAHPAGNSIVASGRHKGQPFGKYLDAVGRQAMGWKCSALQAFPLLVKLIDAREDLSVQAHPGDDYALENENEYGKNEMWYIVDAEPGAGLYVGFNRDVSRNEVERRIRDNTIREVLNFIRTKPGDVFFIPAGTVHAIGAGNLICEIQQSSNCTYRLYDYDRKDKFGNRRELHLEKALEVLDYGKYDPTQAGKSGEEISCKYFDVSIMNIDGEKTMRLTDDSFYSLTCIKGKGKICIDTSIDIAAGETVFIPATDNTMTLSGKLSAVIARV